MEGINYVSNYCYLFYRQVDVADVVLETPLLPPSVDPEYRHIQFSDLDRIATLGIGGFGRVELVSQSLNLTSSSQTLPQICCFKVYIIHCYRCTLKG